MKVFIMIAVAALATSSAMALDTVIGLKGRFDYVHTLNETQPGSAKVSSGVLKTSFLRLVTDLKVTETTNAKLTLDFQPVDSSAGRVDSGVSELVYEAYITKNFNNASLTFGKQAVLSGGRENEYSGRELYLASRFNEGMIFTLTGVTAGYNLAGQNVYVQYLQQAPSAQTPLTDKKVVGIAYYGEFLDKMILPIISYEKYGTARPGKSDNRISAGVRVAVAQVLIEADYLILEQENLAGSADAKLNSVVGHIRYVHDKFQPFVKYIVEEGKNGFAGLSTGSQESSRTAWEVGLEFVPEKDEEFRYHVVYNNSEAKNKSPAPTVKVEEQKIFAGIAFNYNILK